MKNDLEIFKKKINKKSFFPTARGGMRPNLKALPLFLMELWQAEINKQENRKVSKQTSKNNNPSNQIYMCYLEECFQNVGLLSLF